MFKTEVRRLLAERRKGRNESADAARQALARADAEIANIVAAIKAGILTPSTKSALETAEADRARCTHELAASTSQFDNVETILPRGRRSVSRLGDEPRTDGFSRDMSRARNAIRSLVGGSIRLVPTKTGGLNAELQGNYVGLFELAKNESSGDRAGAFEVNLVAGVRSQHCLQGLVTRVPTLNRSTTAQIEV